MKLNIYTFHLQRYRYMLRYNLSYIHKYRLLCIKMFINYWYLLFQLNIITHLSRIYHLKHQNQWSIINHNCLYILWIILCFLFCISYFIYMMLHYNKLIFHLIKNIIQLINYNNLHINLMHLLCNKYNLDLVNQSIMTFLNSLKYFRNIFILISKQYIMGSMYHIKKHIHLNLIILKSCNFMFRYNKYPNIIIIHFHLCKIYSRMLNFIIYVL